MENEPYTWTVRYGINTLEFGPAALRVKFQIVWKEGAGGGDSGYRASINGVQSIIVFKTNLRGKRWLANTTKNNLLLRLENMLETLEDSLEEEENAHAHTP